MKVVLDPNVIISALLSPSGAPAQLVRLWLEGEFDLICSPRLLGELEKAFAYPKLSKHIQHDEAAAFLDLLSRSAELLDDPELLPSVSSPIPTTPTSSHLQRPLGPSWCPVTRTSCRFRPSSRSSLRGRSSPSSEPTQNLQFWPSRSVRFLPRTEAVEASTGGTQARFKPTSPSGSANRHLDPGTRAELDRALRYSLDIIY